MMKAIRYHVPDAGTYNDQTNSVWCRRCQRRIGPELWEQTCPGLPGGVEFDHVFGEGASDAVDRRFPLATDTDAPTPSHTEDA
jgi:hypothetical protein